MCKSFIFRIGGDSDISDRGEQYAMALSYFFNNQNISSLRVWTSWLKRTIQTAANIDAPQERWRALNEIDAGCMEHLTYEDIGEKYPEEYAAREINKLTYRYPSGESYQVSLLDIFMSFLMDIFNMSIQTSFVNSLKCANITTMFWLLS